MRVTSPRFEAFVTQQCGKYQISQKAGFLASRPKRKVPITDQVHQEEKTQEHSHTSKLYMYMYVLGSRGGGEGGPDPPWKITKLQSSLAILVRIPCKFTKLPSQQSMLGHHMPVRETFRRRADASPLLVTFGSSLPHQTQPNARVC